MDVLARWEGAYRASVTVRGFEVVADEPASVGGNDEGPMPTELLLMSLASCFALAVVHVARKRDVELQRCDVRVSGEKQELRFTRMRVEVDTDLDPDEARRLVDRAKQYCYVSRTLSRPPEVEYVVAD